MKRHLLLLFAMLMATLSLSAATKHDRSNGTKRRMTPEHKASTTSAHRLSRNRSMKPS